MSTRPAAVDTAFAALADPTRRAVIRALVARPRRAGELADDIAVSGPALSRHLRVLRQAGLIVDDAVPGDARVRLYRLVPEALAPARDWLGDVERMWAGQLAAFKAFAEGTARPRRRRTGSAA
jgi:DNA-binding transcriptional ArsR family regulator